MADTLSTTLTLDNLLSTYFVRLALPRLTPRAVLFQFGVKTPLPKGAGSTARWNGWSNFGTVTGALGSEGVTPSAAGLSSRTVTATVLQYGRTVKITDLIDYTSSLDVTEGAIENLADSAGRSVDKVVQIGIFRKSIARNTGVSILSSWMSCVVSAFHAGTPNLAANTALAFNFPAVFGTTATQLSAVDKDAPSTSARMSLYAIRKTVKQLRAKDALEYADGYFKGVTNTDAWADLKADPDFKTWYQYTGDVKKMESNLTGEVEGVKWYLSNNLPKYRVAAHSCDISFIFGQGAYGVTTLGAGKAKGFEMIVKTPGPGDTSNPMNLYSTVSYKFSMAPAALNVSAGRILFTHAKP